MRSKIVRALIAIVTLLLWSTIGWTGASAAEPVWPGDLQQPRAIFSAQGEDGTVGFAVWNYTRFAGPAEGPHFWAPGWEQHPLDPAIVSGPSVTRPQSPPADPFVPQAVRGYQGEPGFWVWNPLAAGRDDSVTWRTNWEWAPTPVRSVVVQSPAHGNGQ